MGWGRVGGTRPKGTCGVCSQRLLYMSPSSVELVGMLVGVGLSIPAVGIDAAGVRAAAGVDASGAKEGAGAGVAARSGAAAGAGLTAGAEAAVGVTAVAQAAR